MGKVITAVQILAKAKISVNRGVIEFEETFYGFLIGALNSKAPMDDLEKLCLAKGLRTKLKAAEEEQAQTLTIENDEFKVLSGAVKAFLPGMYPAAAMECEGFLKALESKSEKNPGGVQDVDLSIKK